MNNRLRNRIVPTTNHRRVFDYKIKNDSSVEIVLYDEIGVWGTTASDFMEMLISANERPINLRISSPGGDVFEALAIYNNLKTYPADVSTQVDGLAASAASYIAMAGETRTIARNAMVMIHDAIGFTVGNAEDHRKQIDLLEGASNTIADIYAQRAGGTKEDWRAKMKEETWYYSGQEATDAGLTTAVYEPDSNPIENKWDLSLFNFKKSVKSSGTDTDFPQSQPSISTKTSEKEEIPDLLSELELVSLSNALKEAFK